MIINIYSERRGSNPEEKKQRRYKKKGYEEKFIIT